MYMGFFGVPCGHLLLCDDGTTADRRRRAHRDGVTSDICEDPGDSDAHLLADGGHLCERSAAGAGGRGRFRNQGDDGSEDCS